MIAEAPITCEACAYGHGGRLARPCRTNGCECYCNRPAATTRVRVLFASAFRGDGAECIAHISLGGEKTLCGRLVRDAETVEEDASALPDCRPCARRLRGPS